MKKKTFLSFLSIALLGVLLLSSCEKEQPIDYKAAFATVIPLSGEESVEKGAYLFLTDDSLILLPNNYGDYPKYEPNKDDRVVVYFQKEETPTPTSDFSSKIIEKVKVLKIEKVLTKKIVMTEKIDTLGNSNANPQQIWYSGGIEGASRFVTIEFIFYASSTTPVPHIVNLAQDIKNSPVVDGYYQLEFRHDDRGDLFKDIRTFGYLTVPIPEAATAEGIKGMAIKFNTEFEGYKTIKVNY